MQKFEVKGRLKILNIGEGFQTDGTDMQNTIKVTR